MAWRCYIPSGLHRPFNPSTLSARLGLGLCHVRIRGGCHEPAGQNPFAWPLTGQALVDGWAAVEKAMAAEAPTEREQAYIAAIAEFYRDAATLDHGTRATAYAQAMEQLALDFPEDTEATILLCLGPGRHGATHR